MTINSNNNRDLKLHKFDHFATENEYKMHKIANKYFCNNNKPKIEIFSSKRYQFVKCFL